MFCPNCGSKCDDNAVVCVQCGCALPKKTLPNTYNPHAKDRLTYILLGWLLGIFGAHNFYAGYSGRATAQLLITICTLFIGSIFVSIWAIVEIATVTEDAEGTAFNPVSF